MENQPHYKCIFLIISSSNEPCYAEMKKIIPLFYSSYIDKIKYFFIEYTDLQPNVTENSDVVEKDDHLFIYGKESYVPGIYIKTLRSIEHINTNYKYDFIIRTNLSSFWNMNNAVSLLNILPTNNFACGYIFQGFMSGTCILMSRDVGNTLYSNPIDSDLNDDVLISRVLLSFNVPLYDIEMFKWGYLIPPTHYLPKNCRFVNIDEPNIEDILLFRIKNADRNTDVCYFKILMRKIYGIQL
jgi:hypothetical protein